MNKNKADSNADINAAADRNEAISMIEPMLIAADSRFRNELNDLPVDLAARAAGFRRSLPEGILQSLADW